VKKVWVGMGETERVFVVPHCVVILNGRQRCNCTGLSADPMVGAAGSLPCSASWEK